VHDKRKGAIYVGGKDVREIQLKSLRSGVCYLLRDPVLFEGTVASSLLFIRPNASGLELLAVLHLADLDEVLAAFPGGLYQRIGPDGCRQSGGLKSVGSFQWPDYEGFDGPDSVERAGTQSALLMTLTWPGHDDAVLVHTEFQAKRHSIDLSMRT
jgi:hypothetical protein